MQKLTFLIACLLTSLFAAPAFAADTPATPADTIHVAKYKGDRAAAISYTFDDGRRDHYTLAWPMLKEFGFHSTFFIVASPVPDASADAIAKKPGEFGGISWSELKEMAADGQEIANHTWTHQNLVTLDDAALHDQIDKCAAAIKDKIGVAPISFCYPGNSRNAHVREVALQTHLATREYQKEIGTLTMTTDDANAWADETVKRGAWGVTMIHGISTGYHPLSSPDVLRNHLAYVHGHAAQIWVETFGNVARYVAERDAAVISDIRRSKRSATFTVTTSLANPLYDFPLTIVVPVPSIAAGRPKATRDGSPIPCVSVEGAVLVDVAPSHLPVTVTW